MTHIMVLYEQCQMRGGGRERRERREGGERDIDRVNNPAPQNVSVSFRKDVVLKRHRWILGSKTTEIKPCPTHSALCGGGGGGRGLRPPRANHPKDQPTQ